MGREYLNIVPLDFHSIALVSEFPITDLNVSVLFIISSLENSYTMALSFYKNSQSIDKPTLS